ncbi:hypothetical protein [Dysgonomonas sp. Marseille-P4361]|uniref:hypothetical protein n=1 Tax=Dysgonomonas sp. Marseille-P4361 TaxID=2161820 RepID=UPI000D5518AD|nr:hypothetical protein [Dysgonomonas sp. Marseille-P4361]
MQTKIFNSDELKDLKIAVIARKHKCSTEYVRMVLTGERERNTELARKIVKDACDVLEIINRETKVTL